MFIENYIPFGYKNRISRETLEALTHQGDRTNRERMAEALYERHILIVNIDNAYFRPDGSPEDTLRAEAYYRRECARTGSCKKRCDAIRECLRPKKHDELSKNQISLKQFGIG